MTPEDKKKALNNLVSKAVTAPVQEIKPVKGKYEREGFHLNCWLPEEFEKPIKRHCVEHDITIREFMIQIINEKLKVDLHGNLVITVFQKIKIDYLERFNLSESGIDLGETQIGYSFKFVSDFMAHWVNLHDKIMRPSLAETIDRFITYDEFINFHKHDKAVHVLTQFSNSERFKIIFPPSEEGYFSLMSEIAPSVYTLFFRPLRVMIPPESLAKHCYIIGSAGAGKSTMIKNLVDNSVDDEDMCTIVIDPNGDMADEIARSKRFAPGAKDYERLVYFNTTLFKDEGLYPVINPFDQASNIDLATQDLASILNNIFSAMSASKSGEFTPLMKGMVAPIIHTLFRAEGDFFDFIRFLDDKHNSDLVELGKNGQNEIYSNYFSTSFMGTKRIVTKEAVQMRMYTLMGAETFQYITTGPSTINLRECIEQRKVIVIAPKKGSMGSDNAVVFGKFIACMIHNIAQHRAEQRKEDRIPTIMYVDEFQNYTSKETKDTLAEARKYKLSIVAAQQNVGQDQDLNFQIVLMGNTFVKIMGTTNHHNWKAMGPEMGLTVDEMRDQPDYHYYVKVGTGKPFITSLSKKFVDNNNAMSDEEWKQVLQRQKTLYYTDSPSIVATKFRPPPPDRRFDLGPDDLPYDY